MSTEKTVSKATQQYADADLNQLLKTLKTLETLGIDEALEYVRIVEQGIEQLKVFAVKKASDTYMSNKKMAEHLGMSRQTFANRMQHTIDMYQKAKKENPAAFRNRLEKTDRFIDGLLQKTTERQSPRPEESTEGIRIYIDGFRSLLNTKLDEEDTAGVGQLFAEALRDGTIDPIALRTLQDCAEAFLAHEYDYDEFGDPLTYTRAEHECLRLQELSRICGLTDAQKRRMAKAKAKMTQEQAELDKQMKKEMGGNPFAGFNLPTPTPAASKLPDNLIEEWEKYQEAERQAGRKPTQEAFAKQYGVSRPTFSRELKKAKEKASAQE